MTIYRATFQRATGTLRGLTFAASDDRSAERIAQDWQLADTLLVLKPLRQLQPVLTLEA